jgi:GTPase Era involved in 16S rRNA processing
MSTEMKAYQVSDKDPTITVLKWIAGIISATAAILIASGIIGGIATLRAFDQMSGTVKSNSNDIAMILDLKASKETVNNTHQSLAKDINANSARIVVLSNRIDKLYRKTVYHPPLKQPDTFTAGYIAISTTSCKDPRYASANS